MEGRLADAGLQRLTTGCRCQFSIAETPVPITGEGGGPAVRCRPAAAQLRAVAGWRAAPGRGGVVAERGPAEVCAAAGAQAPDQANVRAGGPEGECPAQRGPKKH